LANIPKFQEQQLIATPHDKAIPQTDCTLIYTTKTKFNGGKYERIKENEED
jgi:hypothetical protein